MKYLKIFILFGILFLPKAFIYASVSISEIAWMGTAVSSTNEWIELANDGDTEDVSGWTITTSDNGLHIILSGNISTGGFYLIERTDDNTVPSIPADLIAGFGHGLSNSGENLILKKSDGSIVQIYDFSTGWPAGDNTINDTMQWSGSSWVTGSPTPKAVNISNNKNSNTNNSSTQNIVNSGGGLPVPVSTEKKIPVPVIPKSTIVINAPKYNITDIETKIGASVYDAMGQKLYNGYFVWSMGDGTVIKTRNLSPISHIYHYAGDYTLALSYFDSEWEKEPSFSGSVIISIIKPTITMAISDDKEGINIKNSSDKDINISKWILSDGNNKFIFPIGMSILAGKTITIANSITNFTTESIKNAVLSFPNGVLVNNLLGFQEQIKKLENDKQYDKQDNNFINKNISENNKFIKQNNQKNSENNNSNIDLSASVANSKPNKKLNLILGFIGVLFLGSYGIFRIYNKKENLSDDRFSLIDE